MTNEWINKYVGIPFKVHGRTSEGADCYGLVKLVLAQEKAIFLPEFHSDYEKITDYDRIANALSRESADDLWTEVLKGQERPLDIMIANMMGFPMHCGIVAYKNHVLHLIEGSNAVCENYTRGKWSSPGRIVGFFRHKELL